MYKVIVNGTEAFSHADYDAALAIYQRFAFVPEHGTHGAMKQTQLDVRFIHETEGHRFRLD